VTVVSVPQARPLMDFGLTDMLTLVTWKAAATTQEPLG
jgi:hypothetical protein